MTSERTILSLHGIEYAYGDIPALRGIDFDLQYGEIHALVGDHRSGKSTLAKLIGGYRKIQKGNYYYKGEKLGNFSLGASLSKGIGMVQQDKELIPAMNVVDNIFIGTGPRFILSRKEKLRRVQKARELIQLIYPGLPMDLPVYKLSEHQKLFVNIAKALAREPEVLIVDEISQSMTPREMEQIYALLFMLRNQGKSIIYITSNFNEIFKVADRVTIFKDGLRQGTESVGAVDPSRILNMAFNFSTSIESLEADQDPIPLGSSQEHIINELPIGDVIISEKGRVVIINQAASALLEHPVEKGDPLQKILNSFKVSDQEEIKKIIFQEERHTFQGLAVGDHFINLTLAPIYNKNRNSIGTNIMLQDVSFDYHTREYLMQVKKVASTAELAAGVAHEIKNPLAIIQNYLELLKLSLEGESEKEYVGFIESELKRIVEIIGNLLSFSRVRQSDVAKLNIISLLDEIAMLLGHQLNKNRINLEKSFPSHPVFIMGEENKLKQLFLNLISNSIDAVLERGKIRLEIEEDRKERAVRVSVIDDGYGIPLEIQDDIFTPFYTTKVTRTNTGLGLSICQNIAEAHGGVITFQSTPGKGTRFTVALPSGI
ncbi:MAG: ATP-binding cassette domain-containing protein [Spirochaetales bacterium]|nr:ATP-binding cassette domain-containing protein [Spirochaetales bacterium]